MLDLDDQLSVGEMGLKFVQLAGLSPEQASAARREARPAHHKAAVAVQRIDLRRGLLRKTPLAPVRPLARGGEQVQLS